MKLLSTCKACDKKRLFIKKREYKVPNSSQTMVSQNEICGKCYKNIKKMIKSF